MGILRLLLHHRRLVAALHFALALAMLPGVFGLENDNSPQVFFARDAGALQRYRRVRQELGGGQAVRVALRGPGVWTPEGLSWLGDLEERAASLPGVQAAVGLAAHHRWLLLEWPPADPQLFRSQVLESGSGLVTGLMSPDGGTVTLLVVFADLSLAAEAELMDRLDGLVARTPPGVEARLSGLPVLHRAMDRSLVEMAARFLPLLVLLASAFLAVVFRRPRDVAVPLLFVAVCQSILFGTIGYLGIRLNLVNIVLAPLLFVISLATAVHLLVRFRELTQRGAKTPTAVLATYRDKGWPVLWTGLTTLVAFGSLVTASSPPLRSLGASCALGIAVMTVLAFSFYPTLLAGAPSQRPPPSARPFELWARRRGRMWARWSVRRRSLVAAVAVAAAAVAVVGIARLRVEDNLARYFPPDHPVRAELERLHRSGVGVFSAELFLSYRGRSGGAADGEEPGFQNPSAQQRLASLSSLLRSRALVHGAVSSGDLVEATIRSIQVDGELSDNTRWMALGLMQMAPESRALLHSLVTEDGQSARVTLLVPMLSFQQMEPLFERAVTDAASIFPGAEAWVTGEYPLILLAQRKLLRGLVLALSLTLLCVALVFLVLLRRARLTLLVLLPNLWPVALVLGAMGWLGVALDSASVMTACVVLGLAVDDTFHTLGYFLRLAPHKGPAAAIEATLERTAPAHILTSLILVAGFAACSFSDLLPVSRMGSVSAVAIALALLGDLVLIPALLAGAPVPAAAGHGARRRSRAGSRPETHDLSS